MCLGRRLSSPHCSLKQVIMDLYQMGEAVAVTLDREVRLRLSVQDQSQATSGVVCVVVCTRVCGACICCKYVGVK